MKKIYINEGFLSNVVKGRLLPQFLFKLVKTHTTSLGDNDAFPTSDEYPFDYALLKNRYNEVCDAIDDIGLESLDEDYLMSELSSLVKECKELETPVRDALEKICENAINRLFAIPEESINMSFKLVDKIKFKSAIRMRPESSDDVKYTFKDIADIDLSNKAISKRRFINALIQGASYIYSNVEGLYLDDIDRINPKLPRLYRRIRIINDYLLFTKKEEMSDDKPMQGSYVETHLGIDDEKTTIKAQGIIFPLLFHEAIKGLFELFSSHGLPQDREKAQYIVKKADFVLAEPWDLRLGVGLWKMIFGGIEDTNMIPYMFTSFVKIPTEEFNVSAKEILSNTEKGNEIINTLMKNAEYDNGYQQFTNRINARNVNKSLIKDSYFTGAETNGYEIGDNEADGDVIEEDELDEPSYQSFDTNHNGIETWYRGLCGSFDELKTKRQIWLADEAEYAADYAYECEDGHLYEFDIDTTRLNLYDWYYEADSYFDPIDGFSEEEQMELMEEGYNGYSFALDDANVLVLFDKSLITNVREIPLNNYITESRELIYESQESKSITAAKKLVMQRFNYNEQEADEFIRIKLRNDIPTLRTPQGGKFILGATRMFCDGELRTANDIGNLNSTLKLVASDAHINEYDRNLNGLSAQELVQRFARAMSANLEAEKAEIGQMAFNTPSDYEVVRIDSFEQAEEYGQYVSWCVTHDENMFNSYSSDGINQFYFCLKNGFENVEKAPSEGCPLDEYGLSMIAVSVNENGMLNTCTCRWNHDNGGDDSIMNAKEVSQVIGMNFFEVFKPNNKWKDLLSSVMQRLENGEDPRNVFDYADDFCEGFTMVALNGKYNFINQEGKLLSGQWFDSASNFREGFARVQLNRKYNFINLEGRILSNQWFDYVGNFHEGFAVVELNGKYNFINQEGRLLSDQWFGTAMDFNEGFAVVELNGKYNFINQEGRLLSDQWFDYVDYFLKGFARVELNGKFNLINQEGRLISNQWFNNAYDFREGFAVVELNGDVYKLDTSGNLTLIGDIYK